MFVKYLDSLVKKYYFRTMRIIENSNNYIKKITLLNKQSGELYQMSSDFLADKRSNAIYYNSVSTYLANQCDTLEFIPVFVTLTLPTEYHQFKQARSAITGRSRLVANKKFINDDEHSINAGYKLLNSAFRQIYNNFFVSNKRINIKYFRVVEPHKDFTPHLHALLYVPAFYINEFKQHFKNIHSSFSLGEQYDFTILRSARSATSYIMKYVKKSLSPSSASDMYVIHGWASVNKIRIVSYSRTPLPRYVFDKLSRNIDLSFGMDKYCIISNVLNYCSFDIVYCSSSGVPSIRSRSHSALLCEAHFAYFEVRVRSSRSFSHRLINYSDVSCRDDVLDFLDNLILSNFDFYKLHKYEYDEFFAFSFDVDLAYLSVDFDFVSYYKRMIHDNYHNFIDLYNNFVYDIASLSSSYTLVRSVVFSLDNPSCGLDDADLTFFQKDFSTVYDSDDILVRSML